MPVYRDIQYTLTRSDRRKTASIYIKRDGSISVRVPDHSPAFWSEEDKILPDYRERRRWLREHGAGMDL